MTLTLTIRKKEKIKKLCKVSLSKEKPTIRLVAQLLGNVAAAFEAVLFGRLYNRLTEKDKTEALKKSKGKFYCHMTLLEAANLELVWWEQNISESSRSLIELPIADTIFTDASNMGWGTSSQFGKINGRWTDKEKDLHINNIKLLGFFFVSLKFLGKHVRIMSESATAVTYIYK